MLAKALTRPLEQRPAQDGGTAGAACRHTREPGGPRSSQQSQQHGFGLILLMMGEQKEVVFTTEALEHLVTRPSQAILRRGSCLGTARSEGNAERLAGPGATSRPCGRVGMHGMIDMQRLQTGRGLATG
jgi:hypothetical protein